MNFFSKLFGNKKSEQNTDKTSSKATSLSNNQQDTPSQKLESGQTPRNLPEALRFIVDTRGKDFLLNRAFINILDDFHVLKDIRAAKNILTNMLSNGYIEKIVTSSNWQLDSLSICKQYVNEYATKEGIVTFIIQSFGYSLNKVAGTPNYDEQTDTLMSNSERTTPTKLKPQDDPAAQTVEFTSDGELRIINAPTTAPPQPPKPINPREPFIRYRYPILDLLHNQTKPFINESFIREIEDRIVRLLSQNYGIFISEIKVYCSNIVDYIECVVHSGTRLNRLKMAEDDFALSLSTKGIRLLAPIPGTDKIGIEIPAHQPYSLSLRSIVNTPLRNKNRLQNHYLSN